MIDRLKRYKGKVDRRLKGFLEERINRVKDMTPVAKEMMQQIKEFNLQGGKRIRPILTIIGYKACGGTKKSILDAAIAVELMESFLLIHDDIMDQDELRRGYLTMHKVFSQKCNRKFKCDGKRYGENMAIIAGDILSILGSEAILKSKFPIENKLKAVDRFNRAVINTCIGQAMDVTMQIDTDIKKSEVHKMYELKTAIYTFEAPLHIGALLAGASKNQLKSLTDYAIPLGKAFQLQDDILGLYGTRQKIGAPVGSDIREGKRTLLVLRAFENSDTAQKSFLKKTLGKQDLTTGEIKEFKEVVKKTNALDYCQDEARKYANTAKSVLKNSKLNKEGKRFLSELADYVVEREY